jgi:hypothetical protein
LIFAILLLPPEMAAQRRNQRGNRDVASQNRRQNSIARRNFQRAEMRG